MTKLLNLIQKKEIQKNPPIWVMRQAGRYLPEYMEVRKNVSNFLDLCYNPKLASEVTLQPIRRFGFDAAIIFSDILVIPDALGIDVKFVRNEGPKLQKIDENFDLNQLDKSKIKTHLKPVFEALEMTKSSLDGHTSLIGFSGSPFTLACYMIEGGGSKNFENTRRILNKNPKFFFDLIDLLSDAIIDYLSLKIKYGADIVKLFDSWAGILPPSDLQKWVINPTIKITNQLQEKHPNTPIICFPKGIGVNYLEFAKQVNCDVLAIDQSVEKNWARKNLQQDCNKIIQGNLDNYLLAFGSKENIKKEVIEILETLQDKPFIFNLGHGILPQTPIENLEMVVDLVKNY
ncbi:MAG: uroporphyrinogen decarboxylase [Rickettsiales bacterium]|nr:uroporphyrinogen decarboxylase [Rickettsiales bacterium]